MKKGMAVKVTIVLIAGALFLALMLLAVFLLQTEGFPLLEQMKNRLLELLK